MAISHAFSNAVADGTNTSIVRPSDWNSAHNQFLTVTGNTVGQSTFSGTNIVIGGGANITLSGVNATRFDISAAAASINLSAGTTSNNLTAVTFSDSNGVSFGLNGSVVTATVQTNYLTTARASTDAIGLATAQSNVTWTVNSAGLSLDARGYAGTVTGATNASVTANSNGVSVSVGPYITTARASNDAVGLNTAQSNVTWTVNSAGLSLDARGYAGTATGATSASITVNSNGVSVSIGPYLTTAMLSNAATISNIRVSGGTTSNLLSAITFGDANGVSFGLNAGTMTASHNALTSQSNQNVTAGNGGFAFQTLSFSNVNGLSFGTSAGSAITASYTVPTVTNSSWTVSDNASSATVARLAFTNINGVTLSLSTGANGSHTIVGSHNALTSQSNQNVTAGNGGFAFQTLSFSNVNGISFGTSAGSAITASHNAITTARASTDGIGLNTAQTNVTWTVNSAGLSLNAAGYAGTGTTFNGANISGSMTVNSVGVQLSLSGATAAPSPVNISAGTTSNNLATVVFSDSNGVSFGLNGSTITATHNGLTSQSNQAFSAAGGSSAFQTLGFSDNAYASWTNTNGSVALTEIRASLFAVSNTTQSSSGTQNIDALSFAGAGVASVGVSNGSVVISVPAGGGGGGLGVGVSTGGNTAGSTGTVTTGNVVFVGTNGITLSQSTGAAGSAATITILGANPQSMWEPVWQYAGGGSGYLGAATQDPGNGTVRVFPIMIGHDLVVSKALASVSIAIQTSSNSSHGGTLSFGVGVYTRNASTLSLISSALGTYAWTNTSNNSTLSLQGLREITAAFGGQLSLTRGDYWMGFWSRTSTVNANWWTGSNMVILTSGTNSTHSGAFVAAPGGASFQPGLPGNGTFSASSSVLPGSMAFSNITGTARWWVRPRIAMRNFDG